MLLLPEGKRGEEWDFSKNSVLLEIGQHWKEKYFRFF